MTHQALKVFILSLFLTFGYGSVVFADDTDIYLGDGAEIIRPNLLFVLDTSDSMNVTVDGTDISRLESMRDAMNNLVLGLDNINVGLMRFNGRRTGDNDTPTGGAVIFPVNNLDDPLSVVPSEANTIQTITVPISTSADDVTQVYDFSSTNHGQVSLTGITLDFPAREGLEVTVRYQIEASTDDSLEKFSNPHKNFLEDGEFKVQDDQSIGRRRAGLRFNDINIPADSEIVRATLGFTASARDIKPQSILVRGENAANPSTFDGTNNHLKNRFDNATPETVKWSPATWSAEEQYSTPNLVSIVSALTSSANGWVANNSMVFLLEDEEENAPNSARRRAYSFDSDALKAPTLDITYRSPTVAAEGQLIGLRFQDVGIPQGADILEVHLEFVSDGPVQAEVDELAVDPNTGIQTGADIYIENSLNSAPYTPVARMLWPDRNYSLGRQRGNIGPAVEFDLVEMEPTFSPTIITASLEIQVDSIVSNPGWCGGNAMAFVLLNIDRNKLQKHFKSFDSPVSADDPVAPAPRLRVTYDTAGITGADTGCNRQEFSFRSAHSKDDATESLVDTVTNVGGNQLRTGNTQTYDSATATTAITGLRFPDINIEQGETILEAYLELTLESNGIGVSDLTVNGELTDNALRFEPTLGNISDTSLRPRTIAQGTITISEDSTVGEVVRSSDLSGIITEIINRDGWAADQAINLFVSGGTNERRFVSFDNNPGLSAQLVILIDGGPESTVRQRVLQLIDQQLHTLNRTPTVETLYEAARYWRGEGVYYGTHRGQGGFPNGQDNPNDFTDFSFNDLGDGDLVNGEDDNTIAGDKIDLYDPDQGVNFGRVSHPDSYTGGTLVQPAGCSSADLDNPACFGEVINGSDADGPVYISPFTIAECQSNYMILLSDGAPTANNEAPGLIADMLPDLDSSADCVDNSKNNVGRCARDLVKFLKQDDQSDLNGDQTVTTYTIGFNSWNGEFEMTVDDPPVLILDADGNPIRVISNTEKFMTELALDGGGTFQTADTSAELTSVFQAIIADIFTDVSSFAAPSLTINAFNKLFHRNEVYFSLFEPSKNIGWDGNIKKYEICDGSTDTCTLGEVTDADANPVINSDDIIDENATSLWTTDPDGPTIKAGGVGPHIPDPGLRKIYSYHDVTAPDPLSPVNLGAAEYQLDISTSGLAGTMDRYDELLGFADGDTSDELKDLLNWIIGIDVDDEDDDDNVTEARWLVSDPLHGSPLALTYGCVGGAPCSDSGDGAIVKVLLGSNDGSIRLFNGSNDAPYGGVEEWVFYPQQMLATQAQRKVNAQGDHLYGVDSTPTIIQFDSNADAVIDPALDEYIRAYFTMRRGGSSIFALDVSPNADGGLTDQSVGGVTPKYLWRIDGQSSLFPDFTNLGQTWSQPKPAFVRVPASGSGNSELKAVLIFGGGYDEPQDDGFATSNIGNSIFIIDADTGERIWWASNEVVTDGGGAAPNLVLDDMDYPIPSDIALLDSNGDGATDRLYVGDMGGQVWRIDLDDQLGGPSSGSDLAVDTTSGARLAVLANSDGDVNGLEDNRKFFYPPDVVQVADTVFSSEPYDLVVIASGDRANPLEDDVLNRVYGLRDYKISEPLLEADQAPLYEDVDTDGDGNDDLYDTTANLIQVGEDDELAAAKAALTASSGWYIDLTEDGTIVGEKGLSTPIVLAGKLFFTSFLPGEHDPCSATEGVGRLYGMDVITGAALFQDWNEDGVDDAFEKGDRVFALGGGIPSGAVPIFQQKGVTLLIGTGGGAKSVDPDIQLPRVKTYWYQEL